jgi:4-hydroxythreonine-4-phosphate dehydrogenase
MRASAATAPLAVSMGDPAGIGLDITLMAWRERKARGLPPFVLFGDIAALRERAKVLALPVPIEPVRDLQHAIDAFPSALPVYAVDLAEPVTAGQPRASAAKAVVRAIEEATASVMRGEAAAVVTNPIAKAVLYEAGFRHPGHTEFLAELAGHHAPGRHVPVMMLACDELRVVPLTIHVPLVTVPQAITRALIFETTRITYAALTRDFGIAHPRIAVCGLNPHAGEDGTIGREEVDVIAPAIAELRAEGLSITGPHSADTLFHAEARATYDAAICMYHDQALIPIKTLAFDRGVNVTLGLPFARTSPDHGTAFAIAGTGTASPESFIAACRMAHELGRRRADALPRP